MTAVVLEYREKECMVPMNINRRIQRVMHFQIPLRSFEATVRLPPEHAQYNQSVPPGDAGLTTRREAASSTSTYVSSASPRSIPVSPIARKRVQLAFSNFSDDVLYQARDRLRHERAATLTGERDLKIPRFNVQDCNEEIYLSCGKHCATKVCMQSALSAVDEGYSNSSRVCMLFIGVSPVFVRHASKCASHCPNTEKSMYVF